MTRWLLALLPAAVSAATWSVELRPNGAFDLLRDGIRLLKAGCPSLVPAGRPGPVSLCAGSLYAAQLGPATRGNDSRLGPYWRHRLSYTPRAGAPTGAATLEFRMFEEAAQIQLQFGSPVLTNWLAPVADAVWSLGEPLWDRTELRLLNVPMDNDIQSMYASLPVVEGTSMFVTSIYHPRARKGLVLGFLEHRLFKSGIKYSLDRLTAVAGVNGNLLTRDALPHGMANATSSPWLSIGLYQDWRAGMEHYADMQIENNGRPVERPDGWSAAPVAGWNSWAMAAQGVGQPNLTNMVAVSDVLRPLKMNGFGSEEQPQVVTRDAVYNVNESVTRAWVAHAKRNGQRVGTYNGPFNWYGGLTPQKLNEKIDCNDKPCNSSDQCWRVGDVLLKDTAGAPVLPLQLRMGVGGGGIRDPTHPQTACMLKATVEQEIANGYTYFKFDFLNMAAYEGERFNMTAAPTGMAAYNYGLALLAEAVNGRAMIEYAISLPLPVGPAGHARHQGCEQMYGGVEYGMNEFAGGWWLNRLYSWLDPDLVTFQGDFWFRPKFGKVSKKVSMDAESRVAKAVVYGGLFKNGDDLLNSTNAGLVQRYLGNPIVNQMWSTARAGVPAAAFRPASWGDGVIFAPSVFMRLNGDVAVFNYFPIRRTVHVQLAETNLDCNATISCVSAWTNESISGVSKGAVQVELEPATSALLMCRN